MFVLIACERSGVVREAFRARGHDAYSCDLAPAEDGSKYHDASKRTALWLKNLPRLRHTRYVEPRIVHGRPRWANQTDSGQNRLSPSDTRAIDRARTYQGVADAMAEQWSN